MAGTKHVPAYYYGNLTERSIKFYDGTYQMDGCAGFWDDQKKYHSYTDYDDPEARAPTPPPAIPLDVLMGEVEDGKGPDREESGDVACTTPVSLDQPVHDPDCDVPKRDLRSDDTEHAQSRLKNESLADAGSERLPTPEEGKKIQKGEEKGNRGAVRKLVELDEKAMEYLDVKAAVKPDVKALIAAFEPNKADNPVMPEKATVKAMIETFEAKKTDDPAITRSPVRNLRGGAAKGSQESDSLSDVPSDLSDVSISEKDTDFQSSKKSKSKPKAKSKRKNDDDGDAYQEGAKNVKKAKTGARLVAKGRNLGAKAEAKVGTALVTATAGVIDGTATRRRSTRISGNV